MLGVQNNIDNFFTGNDKETERHYNNRLIKAYQNAYDSYMSACDRYEKLVQAYRVLMRHKMEAPAGTVHEVPGETLPLTIKELRRMIEDAYREKSVIAEHARECVRHLNSPSYKM